MDAVDKASKIINEVKKKFASGEDLFLTMTESNPELAVAAMAIFLKVKEKVESKDDLLKLYTAGVAMVWYAMTMEQKRFAKKVKEAVLKNRN